MNLDAIKSQFSVNETVISWQDSVEELAVAENYLKRRKKGKEHAHKQGFLPVEFLLPRIECDVLLEHPDYMYQIDRLVSDQQLHQELEQLEPWDFYFLLQNDITTDQYNPVVKDSPYKVARNRQLGRSEIISKTVAKLLESQSDSMDVLDMGCHSGHFSFDFATRGFRHVHGVELREENIRQGRFLAEYYGITNVSFEQGNIFEYQTDKVFDLVLNLGLLYHVVDPIGLMKQTFDLCGKVAVVDTVCHKEPVSGFLTAFNKDINKSGEGVISAELHPTYRGLIDTMYDAGFSNLIEIVGGSGNVPGIYAKYERRCILGFK